MSNRQYRWVLVALLWVVATLNYVDRQVIFSVFPLLQKELSVSNVQLGFLATAFLWVYGVLSPFGGYVADRASRKYVILFGLAVWSAITWLTGHISGYPQLAGARALMGISEAFYLPAALALIADYHDESTRALATGLHQSGIYAGIVLGGAGGGWIGEHYGWRAAFVVLGIVGLIYSGVIAFGVRKPIRQTTFAAAPPFVEACRELFAAPGFRMVFAVNGLISVAYWCVYTWLPLYLYERFRMSLTMAGFSATFYIQVASFGGILAGGWLADRWTRTNPRARVTVQAIGLAAAAPFLFLVGTTTSSWFLVCGLIVFGLGRGFYDCNLMPVVCQVISPNLRATAYGFLNCISCMVGGAMAAAGGALKDTIGLGGALEISAAMLLGAAVLLILIRMPDLCLSKNSAIA